MVIHGGHIIVSRRVGGSYVAFGAAKSCEIEVAGDDIETCNLTSLWRTFAVGKKSWKVSVNGLTASLRGVLFQTGEEYQLKISIVGSSSDYVVGSGICKSVRVSGRDMSMSQYQCSFVGNGALDMFDDPVAQLLWSGGSLSRSSVPADETATLTKGVVIAVYSSGSREDVTSRATFFATRGRVDGTTYTAPSSGGQDVIGVRFGGVTSSTTLSVTVTAPSPSFAYIGCGTSVGAVMVSTNRRTNFGSGLVTYQVAAQSNDYIYVILPVGTPFVDMYMSDMPVWYEQLENTTVDGAIYNVRRTLPLYGGGYNISVMYNG